MVHLTQGSRGVSTKKCLLVILIDRLAEFGRVAQNLPIKPGVCSFQAVERYLKDEEVKKKKSVVLLAKC